jgi:hypothetical protein
VPAETTELVVSMKATIPTGEYENITPMYSLKEIVPTDSDYSAKYDELRNVILQKINEDFERVRMDTIVRRNPNLRFYERKGKKYPSVTSIINWKGIDYPVEQLKQYASLGTIIHELIAIYLSTGKVVNPEALDKLAVDLLILKQGDLMLDYKEVNWKSIIDEAGKEVSFSKDEPQICYNDTFLYAGLPDRLGTYKGEPCLIDFKTAKKVTPDKVEKWYEQEVAYGKCLEGVKHYITILLQSKHEKSSMIVLSDEEVIEKEWQRFLANRENFRKLYGV